MAAAALTLRWIARRPGSIALLLCIAALAGALAWVLSAPRPAFAEADAAWLEQGGDPARGKVLFAAGDCASCHAMPGQDDRLKLGGGLALASPFGTLRVPNISTDPDAGIGRWRTLDLANALLSGVSPDGTHYYPGFPYTSYAHMRPEDVRDLMSYLRTLPAVAAHPPPHELSFPFTIRRLVGFWKLMFFDRGSIVDDPRWGAEWNRGRYLVEAVAHCAECHSSRNALGAIREATRFAGGPDPEGLGFVPNITPVGIGRWSDQQLMALLATGRMPDGRMVGSTMNDVVHNTAELPESDRRAMIVYLRSLPPRPTPTP